MRRITAVGLSRPECLRRAIEYDWLLNNCRTEEAAAFFFDRARLWRSRALVANKEATPDAWYNLGNIAAGHGNHDLAVEAYTEVLALAPHHRDAHLGRGRACLMLGRQLSQVGEAMPSVHVDRQREYYLRAISDFSKAIELDPASADAYNGRGLVHAADGDDIRAIADYSKAIDLAPDYAEAYRNRSRSYLRVGAHNESSADAQKVASLDMFSPRTSAKSCEP